MSKVWENPACKNFIAISKQVKDHLRVSDTEPVELFGKYFNSLFYYRHYLDTIGFKMSPAKRPFIMSDKKTWRYLDLIVKNDKYVGAIENYDYCYKDIH